MRLASLLSKTVRSSWRMEAGPARAACQDLEQRVLLSLSETSPLSPFVANVSSPASDTIDLSTHFNDDQVQGTKAVKFKTSQGEIDIDLSDQVTPKTVDNFLLYVNSGSYDNTIFPRAVDFGGGTPSPATPASIIQGGAFNINNLGHHIGTANPVQSEFNAANPVTNGAGTIAMALSGQQGQPSDPNSGTSEFFFNIADNGPILDPQQFTVFGHVVGGFNLLQNMATFPTVDLSKQVNGALTDLPLQNYTQGNPVQFNNLITINQATSLDSKDLITYTVSTDNPRLVQPTISGHVLS